MAEASNLLQKFFGFVIFFYGLARHSIRSGNKKRAAVEIPRLFLPSIVLIHKSVVVGRTDGADAGASAAIHARIGIDFVMVRTLGDRTDGALALTGTARNTGIGNFHCGCYLLVRMVLF